MFARPAPARSGREALLRKKDPRRTGPPGVGGLALECTAKGFGLSSNARCGRPFRDGRPLWLPNREADAVGPKKGSASYCMEVFGRAGGPARRKRKAERLERVAKGALERIKLDAIAEIEKTFARILGKRNGASRGRPPDRASGGQASATDPKDAREGRCAFYIIERIRKRSEAAR